MPLVTRIARRGLKLNIRIHHFPVKNTDSPTESRLKRNCKSSMENMFQNLCSPKHSECTHIHTYPKQKDFLQSDLKQTELNKSDTKQNDLRQSYLRKSDLRQNDLQKCDMKRKTIKDCFTNLSPLFNIESKDVWQEKARLEKDIYKNKIERNRGADNNSLESIQLKDKSKTILLENNVNARRELFKESMKPLQRRNKVSFLEETKSAPYCDLPLVQWLEDVCVSKSSIAIILEEELELLDVLEVMSRDDLNRIGLKKGPELRIWQQVERYRRESQKRS
jgi:hypothetical protein